MANLNTNMIDTTTAHQIQQTLMNWYDQNKRVLPWRRDQDPYHVWISEIMLQQTQAQTVIPYYDRFLTTLPTLKDLANVKEDDLLKLWEGLGYYSRARNLKKAAMQIINDYQAVWPTTATELQKLTGIGPYTAAAIASISFNEKIPAIDGNAFRVFGRMFEIDADIAKPKTRQIYAEYILPLMPEDRPGDFNQAVMDLGATIATPKNPDIERDPLKAFNQSYQDGTFLDYPVKTKPAKKKSLDLFAVEIFDKDQILMEKRPQTGLLANLYMLPLFDVTKIKPEDQLAALKADFKDQYGLDLKDIEKTSVKVKHVFSHLIWHVTVVTATIKKGSDLAYFPGQKYSLKERESIPQPKVQLKINDALKSLGNLPNV